MIRRVDTLKTLKAKAEIKSEIKYWMDFEKERNRFDKKIIRICKLQFQKERKEIIKNIIESFEQNKQITTQNVLPVNLSNDWNYILKKIYEIVGYYFFKKQLKELRNSSSTKQDNIQVFDELNRLRRAVSENEVFANDGSLNQILLAITQQPKTQEERDNNFWIYALVAFITLNLNNSINIITDTTINNINRIITNAQNSNLLNNVGQPINVQQQALITYVNKLYDQFENNRATTLAMTQVAGASNFGNRISAEASGLQLKHTWISTMDNRVRDIHRSAHGQTLPLNEPFIVGGEKLKYPLDTSLGATARNIVNCRCVERYTL